MVLRTTRDDRHKALKTYFAGDSLTDDQLEDLIHFFEVTVSSLDFLMSAEPAYKFAWQDARNHLETLKIFNRARKEHKS